MMGYSALRRAVFSCVFLVAGCSLAAAQTAPAVTLHFDPARTEIHYTAGTPLHRVHGTFTLKGGLLSFDPATGVAQGQILADAASGHSDGSKDAKLDAQMQNEVLESGKYPEIFFHPEKSVGRLKDGTEQTLLLIGSFNMHGTDHPLKLETHVTLHGTEAVGKADFDVPYVEWGMRDLSTVLFHARVVHISVITHATVEGMAAGKQ